MKMYLWIDVMDCRFKAAKCWVLIKPNFLAKLREIYNNPFSRTSKQMTERLSQDVNKTVLAPRPYIVVMVFREGIWKS